MNDLLKNIRQDRCKTKKDTINSVMSEKTYRNIENGKSSIVFEDLIGILKNLDVTFEEFAFQYTIKHQNSFSSALNNIRKIQTSNNTKTLLKSIDNINKSFFLTQTKKSLLISTLHCISCINNGDIKSAQKHAAFVWKHLKKVDSLYAYELFLLTHIFIVFEFDSLNFIVKKIKKEIIKWRNFRNFQIVEMSFYLNYAKYLEINGYIDKAIKAYGDSLAIAKSNNHSIYSSVSMIRLGRVSNDHTLLSTGKFILNYFDKDLCESILKEE